MQAYGTLGYTLCGSDGTVEAGFEKIVLFAKRIPGIGMGADSMQRYKQRTGAGAANSANVRTLNISASNA